MDLNSKVPIPIFNCKVKQDGNCIFVPVPYGALENFVRSVTAHNEGTIVEILGLDLLDD